MNQVCEQTYLMYYNIISSVNEVVICLLLYVRLKINRLINHKIVETDGFTHPFGSATPGLQKFGLQTSGLQTSGLPTFNLLPHLRVFTHSVIHSFIADIYIAPLHVGLLRNAPNPSARPNNVVLSCGRNFRENTLGSDRRANGRPFHTKGPSTEKARLCMVEVTHGVQDSHTSNFRFSKSLFIKSNFYLHRDSFLSFPLPVKLYMIIQHIQLEDNIT